MTPPTSLPFAVSSYMGLIHAALAVSGAICVFCIVMLASQGVGALYGRLQWRWTRALASLERMRPHSSEPPVLTEHELYMLPAVDFRVVYLVASCVGFALTFALLERGQLTIMSLLGLGAFFLPYLWRRDRISNLEWEYKKQVQALIIRLRMEVSLGRTLSQSLQGVAEEVEESLAESGGGIGRRSSTEEKGVQLFQRRVVYHIRTLSSLARPERVLSALARDFTCGGATGAGRSEILDSLLVKIDAAQRGGATYADALAEAVDETMDSMSQNARLIIQEAPMKLLLPMLGGLFPPPIVLMLLPLVARVLAGMSVGRR